MDMNKNLVPLSDSPTQALESSSFGAGGGGVDFLGEYLDLARKAGPNLHRGSQGLAKRMVLGE